MNNRNIILIVLGLAGACLAGVVCTSLFGLGAVGLLLSGSSTPAATPIIQQATSQATSQNTSAPTSPATRSATESAPTAVLATPTRSIQRQNTPPIIAPATNTPTVARPTSTPTATAVPPTSTPTPEPPTDTPPPPPPTNTPRPPAREFQVTFSFRGYADWGRPDPNDCNRTNNQSPVRQLIYDVTVTNTSSKDITLDDWFVPDARNNGGGPVIANCYYRPPDIPRNQSNRATFEAYVERGQWVSRINLRIRNSTYTVCLDANARELTCR